MIKSCINGTLNDFAFLKKSGVFGWCKCKLVLAGHLTLCLLEYEVSTSLGRTYLRVLRLKLALKCLKKIR